MRENKKPAINANAQQELEFIDILEKKIGLQEKTKEPSFLMKTIYVFSGIAFLMLVGLVCAIIYKSNLGIESILSTLLAFFSIFISVFFYFKADETSSKFYDSSYKFMKDISVTLGKIEERFGEKLDSLNDKISHLDREREKASEEIEEKQEDKRIINELMAKASLNAEEKEDYKQKIEKKDREIAELQSYRMRAEREAAMLRRKIDRITEFNGGTNGGRTISNASNDLRLLSPSLIQYAIELAHNPDDIPLNIKNMLKKAGCIDSDGNIILERLYKLRNDAMHE